MNNEKQQTAIEWLIEQIEWYNRQTLFDLKREILQAKEMEKERMIKFTKDWYSNSFMTHPWKTAEEFYNETYGGN